MQRVSKRKRSKGKKEIMNLKFSMFSPVCCLFFIDGPISGPTSCTQNAGAERHCNVQLPRGPVWLDSAVRLDAFLRLGVAVSWEMKVVSITCLLPFTLFLAFFFTRGPQIPANDF